MCQTYTGMKFRFPLIHTQLKTKRELVTIPKKHNRSATNQGNKVLWGKGLFVCKSTVQVLFMRCDFGTLIDLIPPFCCVQHWKTSSFFPLSLFKKDVILQPAPQTSGEILICATAPFTNPLFTGLAPPLRLFSATNCKCVWCDEESTAVTIKSSARLFWPRAAEELIKSAARLMCSSRWDGAICNTRSHPGGGVKCWCMLLPAAECYQSYSSSKCVWTWALFRCRWFAAGGFLAAPTAAAAEADVQRPINEEQNT